MTAATRNFRTFPEFLEDVPGLAPYALDMFGLIHGAAQRVHDQLTAEGRDDTDLVRSLRAWASKPKGIGQTWINWYVTYHREYLKALDVAPYQMEAV